MLPTAIGIMPGTYNRGMYPDRESTYGLLVPGSTLNHSDTLAKSDNSFLMERINESHFAWKGGTGAPQAPGIVTFRVHCYLYPQYSNIKHVQESLFPVHPN